MKTTTALARCMGLVMVAFSLAGGSVASAQTPPDAPGGTNMVSDGAAGQTIPSTLPADIDPEGPLAQVVRLVQAGVDQPLILAYINNSTALFNIDADRIIYLNDIGVPSEIVSAMMLHDNKLGKTPQAPDAHPPSSGTTTSAPPPAVASDDFHDALAPYGAWVNIDDYGWCWRPTVVIYNTGWRPYCDNGHWVYTDHGWYWFSGYSWGWATFHYGRWFHHSRYGWCWWPDKVWAPSWVCWRNNPDYCGWAPLPPRTVYRTDVGLVYRGSAVSVGFDFGLGASAFVFVATKDFDAPSPWRHRIAERDAVQIYDRTRIFHNMEMDRQRHVVVNPGIPPRDISTVTRKEIHPVEIHYGNPVAGDRHERLERGQNALIVERPHFDGHHDFAEPGNTRPPEKGGATAIRGRIGGASAPQPRPEPDRGPAVHEHQRQVQPPPVHQPVVPPTVAPEPEKRRDEGRANEFHLPRTSHNPPTWRTERPPATRDEGVPVPKPAPSRVETQNRSTRTSPNQTSWRNKQPPADRGASVQQSAPSQKVPWVQPQPPGDVPVPDSHDSGNRGKEHGQR